MCVCVCACVCMRVCVCVCTCSSSKSTLQESVKQSGLGQRYMRWRVSRYCTPVGPFQKVHLYMVRNQGVGIVLDPAMATSWRESGEVWKAVSSRIVSARLKLPAITPQDGKRSPCMHVTIVSVYAPTFRSPDKLKEEFFADLQHTLDAIDKEDVATTSW